MGLRHPTYGPSLVQFLHLCSHCPGLEKGPHFPGVEGNFFPCFQKRRQHFLSQNNLSLCLTRLPAIFTQLKLQMIYFQLHHSAALWHMVLSIMQVTTEQDCQSSETLRQTEKATGRIGQKETKRRESERGRET